MNRNLALLFVPLLAATFAAQYLLQPVPAIILGIVITAFASIYSLKIICTLVPISRFPRLAQQMLGFFRLAPFDPEA